MRSRVGLSRRSKCGPVGPRTPRGPVFPPGSRLAYPTNLELHADQIRLVPTEDQRVSTTQLLVGDPNADPLAVHELRARGFSSRLALPITHGGETLGYLEAYCRDERPWSRFEIGRARIITHQLGPLLRHTTVATAP
jgi:GAF domain-containing protein